jgi:hypothetical protein
MTFEQAVEDFRQFLRKQGHVEPLVWVTPTEVAFWQGEKTYDWEIRKVVMGPFVVQ